MATLRNSTDIIKGGHLMVFVEKNGTLTPIGFATSHSFSKTLNTQEISCKDFGDVAAVLPQNYSWTMQTDNLYSINGYKDLNNAFKNMEKVLVYFGETNYRQTSVQESIVDVEDAQEWRKEGFGEQGYAYITSLDVTATSGENATFSATFTGTGNLTEVETPIPYEVALLGSATVLSHITLSDTMAEPNETVTATPDSATYYGPYYTCTSNQVTPAWNTGSHYWSFTMPNRDVTLTLSEARSFEVRLQGDGASSCTVEGIYNDQRSYFPTGATAYIKSPSDEVSVTISYPEDYPISGDGHSYSFTMPNFPSDQNAYVIAYCSYVG